VASRELVDGLTVARVLMLTTDRQVTELAKRGILPKAGRGRYDLVACVQAYCVHLREVAAGRSSADGGHDLVAERARLAREQADAQAMKNEQLRGSLIPRADVEELLVTAASACQRRMLSIPTSAAPKVAVESDPRICEAIVREHVEEALEEIADLEIESSAARGSGASGVGRRAQSLSGRVPASAQADG